MLTNAQEIRDKERFLAAKMGVRDLRDAVGHAVTLAQP
jgi:hypothetical protein